MPSISDLGRIIKEQSPNEFDGETDYEVGLATKQAYPGEFDEYIDTALAKPSAGGGIEVSYQQFEKLLMDEAGMSGVGADAKLIRQYQEVFRQFEHNKGAIRSWFGTKRTNRQLEYISNLTAMQEKLLQGFMHQAMAIQGRRERAVEFFFEYQQKLQEFNALQAKIEIAKEAWAEYRMTPEQVGKLNLAKGESTVRIQEYKQKTEIDLANTLKEKQEAVRLALISKHLGEIQKIALIQDNINEIYLQINDIENGRITSSNNLELSEGIKEQMIADCREIIETLKETRRARQQRLRAIDTGTDVRRVDEDTNLR